MITQNYYEGVKHEVHISTSVETKCEHCTERIGGDDLAKSINHYIQQHGYKLLHVGTETSRDMDGNPWQSTVAVLGK